MSKQPTNSQEGRDFLIRMRKLDILQDAISQSKWVFLTIIVWIAYLAVDSLSGEWTTLDIGIKAIARFTSWGLESFLFLFLLFALAGWRREKGLRRREIERFHNISEKYEKLIDPNRSSSHLTRQGQSRPED